MLNPHNETKLPAKLLLPATSAGIVPGAAMNAARLPSLVQRFFTQRQLEPQGLSSHIVTSCRDTFRLSLTLRQEKFSVYTQDPLDCREHLLQVRSNQRTSAGFAMSAHSFNSIEALFTRPGRVFHEGRGSSPRCRTRCPEHGSTTGIEHCFLSRFKQASAIAN